MFNTGNQGSPIEVKTSIVRMEDGKEYMKFTFPDDVTKNRVVDDALESGNSGFDYKLEGNDILIHKGKSVDGSDLIESAKGIMTDVLGDSISFKDETPKSLQLNNPQMVKLPDFSAMQKPEEQKEPESPARRFLNAILKPFRAIRDAFRKEEKQEEKATVAPSGKPDAVVAQDVSKDQYMNFSAAVQEAKEYEAPARESYYNIAPVVAPGPRPNPVAPVQNKPERSGTIYTDISKIGKETSFDKIDRMVSEHEKQEQKAVGKHTSDVLNSRQFQAPSQGRE